MSDFMNEPVEYIWTDEDIIREYRTYGDKKRVLKVYNITMKQLNEILKRYRM